MYKLIFGKQTKVIPLWCCSWLRESYFVSHFLHSVLNRSMNFCSICIQFITFAKTHKESWHHIIYRIHSLRFIGYDLCEDKQTWPRFHYELYLCVTLGTNDLIHMNLSHRFCKMRKSAGILARIVMKLKSINKWSLIFIKEVLTADCIIILMLL